MLTLAPGKLVGTLTSMKPIATGWRLHRVQRASRRSAAAVRRSREGRATAADLRRIARRDEEILAALRSGISWRQVTGQGYRLFWDLIYCGKKEAKERFGDHAGGLIAIQKEWKRLQEDIARDEYELLGSNDVWGWALGLWGAVRDGDTTRLVVDRDSFEFGRDRRLREALAERILNELVRPLEKEDLPEILERGWTPETKQRFWSNLHALDRRLVHKLANAADLTEIDFVLGDLMARALGNRRATMLASEDVELSGAEEGTPTSHELRHGPRS